MHWDLFCRVIDNYGDIGVCWRLAADLAERGERVRLWVDDASALAWMAPNGADGVQVGAWDDAARHAPGDVVVEAFGCELPPDFVASMAAAAKAPAWINLEYLSAEPYVERSHRLPSPQLAGPGAGLVKHFFYPGFTRETGGLIRERGLVDERQAFDAAAWLRAQRIDRMDGERLVSVFCYDDRALPDLVASLPDEPVCLLLTESVLPPPRRPNLRWHRLPRFDQPGYDRLLWSCDLNLVRGEDSFVRAMWAGVPFLWQIYPQQDHAHAVKLDAFLDRFAPNPEVRRLMQAWNGLAPVPATAPAPNDWAARCRTWCEELQAQPDLTTQLLGFVRETG